ncbi:Cytochrome P450 67 [Termitomyces sp. T112]|nr:Cytochrome P450 67 [Termitomyces sp. T112]
MLRLLTVLQLITLSVLTHLYFRKFEPRNPLICALVLVLEPVVFLSLAPAVPVNLPSVFAVYSTFLISLVLSIVLYRIGPWHPLAGYPGPVLNKITQLRNVYVQWSGFQHKVLKELHDQYGPFVRIGPNELSVIEVDAALAILGPGGLSKGRYYDPRRDPNAPGTLLALHGQAHTDRRRIWSRAFTNASLAEYEDALVQRTESLIARLGSLAPFPVDLSMWLSLFSLDFMGDMAFGQGFNLLQMGCDSNKLQKMFENGFIPISIVCQIPWAWPIIQRLPFLAKNILRLRKFAIDHGKARLAKGHETKDLWYHLSDEASLEKQRPTVQDIVADSTLAMIAGSDTTATGLSNLFYFLLCHPHCLKRVRDEIDDVYPKEECPSSLAKHSQLPYLTACINECLRLLPPALSSGPREVLAGEGGRLFGGRFIPEGTQVYIPPYSIHRNPEYFSPGPDDFVPERWLTADNVDNILNLNAFIPFSYGPANCVGRNLARREMFMVASGVIQKFDIRFADGYEPRFWLQELRDHFVSKRGPLLVTLSPRF